MIGQEIVTVGPWAVVGMIVLYLLQRFNILPVPGPAPKPDQPLPAPQFPLLELLLKLLAERFRLPLGEPLPEPRMEAFASPLAVGRSPQAERPPVWAQELLTEIRALKRTV